MLQTAFIASYFSFNAVECPIDNVPILTGHSTTLKEKYDAIKTVL